MDNVINVFAVIGALCVVCSIAMIVWAWIMKVQLDMHYATEEVPMTVDDFIKNSTPTINDAIKRGEDTGVY